jgi:hypothetical protein
MKAYGGSSSRLIFSTLWRGKWCRVGHVVNYVSIYERLPTAFYPVSPPPYANGGPDEFLSWLIETKDPDFTPDLMKTWLEGRLPQPVNDETQWLSYDEEAD